MLSTPTNNNGSVCLVLKLQSNQKSYEALQEEFLTKLEQIAH